jgi:hypothetical protein
MAQCAATNLGYCSGSGSVSVPVTDIFQLINGTMSLNYMQSGGNFVTPGFPITLPSGRWEVFTDRVEWTGTPSSSNNIEVFTFNGTDNDGPLSCTVTVNLDSSCTSGSGSTSSGCLNLGPQTVDIASTAPTSIPVNQLHSSGVTPQFISESVSGIVQVTGLDPLELIGLNVGQTVITLSFNGDPCQYTFNVIDSSNGGGGGGGSGGCLNYTPPNIPVGSSITIPLNSVHSSGAEPAFTSETANGITQVNALNPIIVQGLSIGQNTITFSFNGDPCQLTFNVVAAGGGGGGGGNTCPFTTCSNIISALDGGVETGGATYSLECNSTHTISYFVPNPNNINLDGAIIVEEGVVEPNTTSSSISYDSANQRTVYTMTFTTRAAGCGSSSSVQWIPNSTGNADPDATACPSPCTIVTLLVQDCPDCGVIGGGDGGTTTCTKSATAECEPQTVSGGSIIKLGPATGCDCLGCDFLWVNSVTNPVQIPIPSPTDRTAIITIPASAPDGEYKFFPSCCNCDE